MYPVVDRTTILILIALTGTKSQNRNEISSGTRLSGTRSAPSHPSHRRDVNISASISDGVTDLSTCHALAVQKHVDCLALKGIII